MDFAGMVSPENLLQMVHPNLYHWANVLEKQGMHELLDNNPTWRAHFDALMPLLNGLGLGRHECARELQTRWPLGVDAPRYGTLIIERALRHALGSSATNTWPSIGDPISKTGAALKRWYAAAQMSNMSRPS